MTAVLMFLLLTLASPPQAPPSGQSPQQPAFTEWIGDFAGAALDPAKWEPYSFGGGAAANIKVADGEVHLQAAGESRSGIRTRKQFQGDRFIVEAQLARVAPGIPRPGQTGAPIGNAVLAVMFDGDGRNRIEWILTTEGTMEAWLVRDGRAERLDNRHMGTKETAPRLGIARRGDTLLFTLNGEVGVSKEHVKNLPNHFFVMLYGFGSSENDWKALRVVTPAES